MLAHVVSADGVSSYHVEVKMVTDFLVLQTDRGLRSLADLNSYFRRLIRGFVSIAATVAKLLSRDTSFK